MYIKLFNIKSCKHCSEVALIRQREDDSDYVQIIAWHTHADGPLIQTENVEFEDEALIGRFIADFSEFSANAYANSFNI